MCCKLIFSEMKICIRWLSQFIQASNYILLLLVTLTSDWAYFYFWVVRFLWWLSSSWFQRCCLDHHKIQISDKFWILQNDVPEFVDTDICPLRMFPVAFLLSFWLLNFIRSNTFVIVQKNCTEDQATIRRCRQCSAVVFFNLTNIFATIFAWPTWST